MDGHKYTDERKTSVLENSTHVSGYGKDNSQEYIGTYTSGRLTISDISENSGPTHEKFKTHCSETAYREIKEQ